MIQKKVVYSEIALNKRKAIKEDIKDRYGKERADKFSEHISKTIAKLKQFPEMGSSMRNQYGLDCDYYVLFIEHNYFIYRITYEMILILEIFNEREDFMRQLFGIVTTPQETLDYWGE
ncbi:MAG: type II toxin-antitoxin system RelE/ParE family toxin [Eubacterium sp.]|nr:type II toxin-antitoxin system RelE/ParE family toxin [Eubacterium sp.]